MSCFTPGPIIGRIPDGFVTDAEPLPRCPATSYPEPVEESEPERCGCGYDNPDDVCTYHEKIVRARIAAEQIDANELVPAYSATETAKHYAELAGMVAVKALIKREARALFLDRPTAVSNQEWFVRLFRDMGMIRPDPTPIDRACEAFPHLKREDVEGIVAIVKGEAK